MSQFWKRPLNLLTGLALAAIGCGSSSHSHGGAKDTGGTGAQAPLATDSPWPKFRGNMQQDGKSSIRPKLTDKKPWEFQTGKGIFSSPVIGGDGTVYVGSADRHLYALNADGTLKWKLLTEEAVDSSPLLDDRNHLYFGSGDGHLRAIDLATGDASTSPALVWDFQADSPESQGSYIRWFEGNVAIAADGTLYAPNDNFNLYAVNRDDGTQKWKKKLGDQTWSSPAVNPTSNRLFFGNNFFLPHPFDMIPWTGENAISLDAAGNNAWGMKISGSVCSSPMLLGDPNHSDMGNVIQSGFDGFIHSYSQNSPLVDRVVDGSVFGGTEENWSFGTREHIYASPARLSDNTIIEASTDGSIYALNPSNGSLVWQFDAREPFRASPAVDGDDNIYIGGADGRLYVLKSDGSLRWAIQLIDEDRNDLNASVALGPEAFYLAGENGKVFGVPYDYCLRDDGKADSRCLTAAQLKQPADAATLYYTTPFGSTLDTPPASIDTNQELVLSLVVRSAGKTDLALLDSSSVAVTVTPEVPVTVEVSGDRRFLTILPQDRYPVGQLAVHVTGRYLENFQRNGLLFTGGTAAGDVTADLTFQVKDAPDAPALAVPQQLGDAASAWELYRIAVPLPSVMVDYNQIGFDSLHYLIGLVEGDSENAVGWVVGGMLQDNEASATVVDPTTKVLFPVNISYKNGVITMLNEENFTINAMNFDMNFDSFRVATHFNADGTAVSPNIHVATNCDHITFYGAFLEGMGFCNPETKTLSAIAGSNLRPVKQDIPTADSIGTVAFSSAAAGALGNLGSTVGNLGSGLPGNLGAIGQGLIDNGAGMLGKVTGDIPNLPGNISNAFNKATVSATITGGKLDLAAHALGVVLVDADTGKAISLGYGLDTVRSQAADGSIVVTVPYKPELSGKKVRAHLMVDLYPVATGALTLP